MAVFGYCADLQPIASGFFGSIAEVPVDPFVGAGAGSLIGGPGLAAIQRELDGSDRAALIVGIAFKADFFARGKVCQFSMVYNAYLRLIFCICTDQFRLLRLGSHFDIYDISGKVLCDRTGNPYLSLPGCPAVPDRLRGTRS